MRRPHLLRRRSRAKSQRQSQDAQRPASIHWTVRLGGERPAQSESYRIQLRALESCYRIFRIRWEPLFNRQHDISSH